MHDPNGWEIKKDTNGERKTNWSPNLGLLNSTPGSNFRQVGFPFKVELGQAVGRMVCEASPPVLWRRSAEAKTGIAKLLIHLVLLTLLTEHGPRWNPLPLTSVPRERSGRHSA